MFVTVSKLELSEMGVVASEPFLYSSTAKARALAGLKWLNNLLIPSPVNDCPHLKRRWCGLRGNRHHARSRRCWSIWKWQ